MIAPAATPSAREDASSFASSSEPVRAFPARRSASRSASAAAGATSASTSPSPPANASAAASTRAIPAGASRIAARAFAADRIRGGKSVESRIAAAVGGRLESIRLVAERTDGGSASIVTRPPRGAYVSAKRRPSAATSPRAAEHVKNEPEVKSPSESSSEAFERASSSEAFERASSSEASFGFGPSGPNRSGSTARHPSASVAGSSARMSASGEDTSAMGSRPRSVPRAASRCASLGAGAARHLGGARPRPFAGGCGLRNSRARPHLLGTVGSTGGTSTFFAATAATPSSAAPKVRSIHAGSPAVTLSDSNAALCFRTKSSGPADHSGVARSPIASPCVETNTVGSSYNSGTASSGDHR